MLEQVTAKSKYIEVPQELRDRLIKLHCVSKSMKAKARMYEQSQTEDIEYKGIRQEVKMAGLRTEETRKRIQTELENLEDIREYIKTMSETNKERRKEEIMDILKKEINKGDRKLAYLEERIKLAANKERDKNVLQSIQDTINRLSEKLEHIN